MNEISQPRLHGDAHKTLSIAATFPALKVLLGVEMKDGVLHVQGEPPWIVPHPFKQGLQTLDADQLGAMLDSVSSGEAHCLRFILTVWNSAYAEKRGLTFDMFQAAQTIDASHREALVDWLRNPWWP